MDVELKGEAHLLAMKQTILTIEHFENFHRYVTRDEAKHIAEACIDKKRMVTWIVNHTERFDVIKFVDLISDGFFDVGKFCPLIQPLESGEALMQGDDL